MALLLCARLWHSRGSSDYEQPKEYIPKNAYLEELGNKGSDLTILFKSPVNIPEGPIALRKDIQLYDTLHVEDALLTIGEEDPTVLRTVYITGFTRATDKTYGELLQIAHDMNIDLSTYNG